MALTGSFTLIVFPSSSTVIVGGVSIVISERSLSPNPRKEMLMQYIRGKGSKEQFASGKAGSKKLKGKERERRQGGEERKKKKKRLPVLRLPCSVGLVPITGTRPHPPTL